MQRGDDFGSLASERCGVWPFIGTAQSRAFEFSREESCQHKVTQVAMEATGIYWKPVWDVLEGTLELELTRDLTQGIKYSVGSISN